MSAVGMQSKFKQRCHPHDHHHQTIVVRASMSRVPGWENRAKAGVAHLAIDGQHVAVQVEALCLVAKQVLKALKAGVRPLVANSPDKCIAVNDAAILELHAPLKPLLYFTCHTLPMRCLELATHDACDASCGGRILVVCHMSCSTSGHSSLGQKQMLPARISNAT